MWNVQGIFNPFLQSIKKLVSILYTQQIRHIVEGGGDFKNQDPCALRKFATWMERKTNAKKTYLYLGINDKGPINDLCRPQELIRAAGGTSSEAICQSFKVEGKRKQVF